ncbi:unnamed protein product, partial [Cyprideis torosa]
MSELRNEVSPRYSIGEFRRSLPSLLKTMWQKKRQTRGHVMDTEQLKKNHRCMLSGSEVSGLGESKSGTCRSRVRVPGSGPV